MEPTPTLAIPTEQPVRMNTRPMSDRVREIVRDTFFAMGEKHGDVIQESVLIRNGVYCGHRFRGAAVQAVWFIEEDELKFYGRDGLVCQTLAPSRWADAPTASARAA